jgi:hypothetical protein
LFSSPETTAIVLSTIHALKRRKQSSLGSIKKCAAPGGRRIAGIDGCLLAVPRTSAGPRWIGQFVVSRADFASGALLQLITGVTSGRGHDASCAGLGHAGDTILTLFLSRETGLFKDLCVTRVEKRTRDRLTLTFAVDGD